MTKSTKSQQRECSPLFANSSRVHELVARSSAWRVRAAKDKAKISSFALSTASSIPRMRTYHTKKPSRFVHALSARPLKVQGGREFSLYADGIIKISPISLCSHQDTHSNLNREVRHSLTWHSSKSESALERFEPVAVVKQLRDGRGTLFARVAARRQKVFKRGIDTYAKHVCRRRRDGSQFFPLFVLFVLFGQAKRTLKEKNHNVTFPLSYFSVTKSTKSQQGGLAPSSFQTTAACTS